MADDEYPGEAAAKLNGTVRASEVTTNSALDITLLWFDNTQTDNQPALAAECSTSFGYPIGSNECISACEPLSDVEPCTFESAKNYEQCIVACPGVQDFFSFVDLVPMSPSSKGQSVKVGTKFPTEFSLELFAPPPASAFLSVGDTESRVAVALIAVVDPSFPGVADWNQAREERHGPPGVVGIAEQRLLIYVESEFSADSLWGIFLGGSYGVGYHLLEMRYDDNCTQVSNGIVCNSRTEIGPLTEDLLAPIDVRISSEPDWPTFLGELKVIPDPPVTN